MEAINSNTLPLRTNEPRHHRLISDRSLSAWTGSICRFVESVALTPLVYIRGRQTHLRGLNWDLKDYLVLGFLGLGTWLVVMLINDLSDVKCDEMNPHKVFHRWILKKFSTRTWWFVVTAVSILMTVCTLIWVDIETCVVMLLIILLGFLYSRGARFKENAPWDSVVGGASHAIPYALGQWHAIGRVYWGWTVWWAIRFFALHVLTTLVDYEADKRSNVNSFAVRYGAATAAMTVAGVILFDLWFFTSHAWGLIWLRQVCYLGIFACLGNIVWKSIEMNRLECSESRRITIYKHIHLSALISCCLIVGAVLSCFGPMALINVK
ncbi:MAG: hypothetical protein FJ116_06135 [Deltaproteobacteria bacterium]|nr:hypothetical protein [Deltaproteobacteria bacterium]